MRRLFPTFFVINILIITCAEGVQTFRIGGPRSSAPPLWKAWTDIIPKKIGGFQLLYGATLNLIDTTASPGIQPVRLDPNVNFMTVLWERWKRKEGRFPMTPFAEVGALAEDQLQWMFDSDEQTYMDFGVSIWFLQRSTVDLGGVYRVHRIRVIPGYQGLTLPDTLGAYSIEVAEATKDTSYERRSSLFTEERPVYSEITRAPHQIGPEIDVTFPPKPVRFVKVTLDPIIHRIAEWQVFGIGYVPRASYISNIIDVGEAQALWGRIRWSAEAIGDTSGTQVFIRTQSGTDPDPLVYQRYISRTNFLTGTKDEVTHLSRTGQPLTKEEYDALGVDERVKETLLPYDDEHWSRWSDPYDLRAGLTGVPITSPGPRRYFQVMVGIQPALEGTMKFNFIEFDFAKPVARKVEGEIIPSSTVLEKVEQFTYTIRPTAVTKDDTGFDTVEITVPDLSAGIDSVRIDGIDVPWRDTLLTDGAQPQLQVRLIGQRIDESEELLEIVFHSRVFKVWTLFAGRVLDSQGEKISQVVEPGDVVSVSENDDLVVRSAIGQSVVGDLIVTPNLLTLNGDGINDLLKITYTLFRVTRTVPVAGDKPSGGSRTTSVMISVRIYDLTGRLVRTVYTGDDETGVYTRFWDGKDDRKRIVSPGTYICQVSVDAEAGEERKAVVINVVY